MQIHLTPIILSGCLNWAIATVRTIQSSYSIYIVVLHIVAMASRLIHICIPSTSSIHRLVYILYVQVPYIGKYIYCMYKFHVVLARVLTNRPQSNAWTAARLPPHVTGWGYVYTV